jgi:hypothetical protein
MNCAWCNPSEDENGSRGICDDCMRKYFNIDAQSIHAEIAAEEAQKQEELPQAA